VGIHADHVGDGLALYALSDNELELLAGLPGMVIV
jgi:hypothetical protein